jgi:hypothetical protein
MCTAAAIGYVRSNSDSSVFFTIVVIIQHRARVALHCANQFQNYTLTNHITNGSHNTEKRCREAQASTAFFWFGWASASSAAALRAQTYAVASAAGPP